MAGTRYAVAAIACLWLAVLALARGGAGDFALLVAAGSCLAGVFCGLMGGTR